MNDKKVVCEAATYPEKDRWSSFHPVKCGRPAKAERADVYGGVDVYGEPEEKFPVCGIHNRIGTHPRRYRE